MFQINILDYCLITEMISLKCRHAVTQVPGTRVVPCNVGTQVRFYPAMQVHTMIEKKYKIKIK